MIFSFVTIIARRYDYTHKYTTAEWIDPVFVVTDSLAIAGPFFSAAIHIQDTLSLSEIDV